MEKNVQANISARPTMPLTASVCIGCIANNIPEIKANFILKPATFVQILVKRTDDVACNIIFIP